MEKSTFPCGEFDVDVDSSLEGELPILFAEFGFREHGLGCLRRNPPHTLNHPILPLRIRGRKLSFDVVLGHDLHEVGSSENGVVVHPDDLDRMSSSLGKLNEFGQTLHSFIFGLDKVQENKRSRVVGSAEDVAVAL